jgi:hypothetical protein
MPAKPAGREHDDHCEDQSCASLHDIPLTGRKRRTAISATEGAGAFLSWDGGEKRSAKSHLGLTRHLADDEAAIDCDADSSDASGIFDCHANGRGRAGQDAMVRLWNFCQFHGSHAAVVYVQHCGHLKTSAAG